MAGASPKPVDSLYVLKVILKELEKGNNCIFLRPNVLLCALPEAAEHDEASQNADTFAPNATHLVDQFVHSVSIARQALGQTARSQSVAVAGDWAPSLLDAVITTVHRWACSTPATAQAQARAESLSSLIGATLQLLWLLGCRDTRNGTVDPSFGFRITLHHDNTGSEAVLHGASFVAALFNFSALSGTARRAARHSSAHLHSQSVSPDVLQWGAFRCLLSAPPAQLEHLLGRTYLSRHALVTHPCKPRGTGGRDWDALQRCLNAVEAGPKDVDAFQRSLAVILLLQEIAFRPSDFRSNPQPCSEEDRAMVEHLSVLLAVPPATLLANITPFLRLAPGSPPELVVTVLPDVMLGFLFRWVVANFTSVAAAHGFSCDTDADAAPTLDLSVVVLPQPPTTTQSTVPPTEAPLRDGEPASPPGFCLLHATLGQLFTNVAAEHSYAWALKSLVWDVIDRYATEGIDLTAKANEPLPSAGPNSPVPPPLVAPPAQTLLNLFLGSSRQNGVSTETDGLLARAADLQDRMVQQDMAEPRPVGELLDFMRRRVESLKGTRAYMLSCGSGVAGERDEVAWYDSSNQCVVVRHSFGRVKYPLSAFLPARFEIAYNQDVLGALTQQGFDPESSTNSYSNVVQEAVENLRDLLLPSLDSSPLFVTLLPVNLHIIDGGSSLPPSTSTELFNLAANRVLHRIQRSVALAVVATDLRSFPEWVPLPDFALKYRPLRPSASWPKTHVPGRYDESMAVRAFCLGLCEAALWPGTFVMGTHHVLLKQGNLEQLDTLLHARRTDAAVLIQRQYHVHCVRILSRNLTFVIHNNATRIQAAWRGHSSRQQQRRYGRPPLPPARSAVNSRQLQNLWSKQKATAGEVKEQPLRSPKRAGAGNAPSPPADMPMQLQLQHDREAALLSERQALLAKQQQELAEQQKELLRRREQQLQNFKRDWENQQVRLAALATAAASQASSPDKASSQAPSPARKGGAADLTSKWLPYDKSQYHTLEEMEAEQKRSLSPSTKGGGKPRPKPKAPAGARTQLPSPPPSSRSSIRVNTSLDSDVGSTQDKRRPKPAPALTEEQYQLVFKHRTQSLEQLVPLTKAARLRMDRARLSASPTPPSRSHTPDATTTGRRRTSLGPREPPPSAESLHMQEIQTAGVAEKSGPLSHAQLHTLATKLTPTQRNDLQHFIARQAQLQKLMQLAGVAGYDASPAPTGNGASHTDSNGDLHSPRSSVAPPLLPPRPNFRRPSGKPPTPTNRSTSRRFS
eukprot:TRINITY_DN21291_c0_g1_i1.p1 TRINITY_DN21291_c0_g1~~TRINITY_DN21291_c0_g1_i1.p1  ORF type:complete len:1253 (+),score=162.71 TRINITY_DN21291_c0_g1_i1:111-3869(+)